MDNITLKDFSDEELLAELDRRKKPKFNPKQISECNFTKLYSETIESIEFGYDSYDFDHQLWEIAVEAIYGPDIWEKLNSLDRYKK